MPARFVCFTAYHLLLAETIARQADFSDAEAVWTDEPGLGQVVDEVLNQGALRVTLQLMPIGATRGWSRGFVYVRNRRSLRLWLGSQAPGPLYVFNPLRPESRAVAERLGGALHFVEDGLEAYRSGTDPDRWDRWSRRAASALMRVQPFLKRNFVEYGAWRDGWALLPGHIYEPPRTPLPPMRAVDPEILRLVIERWHEHLPRSVAFDSYSVLAMLDHPDQVAGLTAERTVGLAATWGVGSDQVLVKPHPRDPRPLTVITGGLDVHGVEGRWPVEAMLSTLRSGAIVVGGNSTGMLLAAILRPDLDLRLTVKENAPLWRLLNTLDARVRLEPRLDA